jgi:hypothetical protein
MQQIIPCCGNFLLFEEKKNFDNEAAGQQDCALKFIYRFPTFDSTCSVCLGPLKPRYRVPVRSSPWNEVTTAACCLHVIKALLLFRVHSRGSPNLLFSLFCRKYSWLLATVSFTAGIANLQCYFVRMSSYNAVFVRLSTIELHTCTNAAGRNTLSLETIC